MRSSAKSPRDSNNLTMDPRPRQTVHGSLLTVHSLSVFMPAYNAAAHIEATIGRIPGAAWERIEHLWIVNDGSTDTTGMLIDKLASGNARIKPVHFPQNRGYGCAVREGLSRCRTDGCDYAVCLHADGQYPPEQIPGFVEIMARDGVDILQGSRIASGAALSGGMPVYKYVGNRALTFFENLVFGLRMTDYHSGYVFYSRNALETIPFERLSTSFDFDLEVIASARSRGMKVAEQPIPTRYAGEVSHVNSIAYGLRCVGVMRKFMMGRYCA